MSSSVTSTSTSWSGVRCWRTAFLTLRDETLTSPPPPLAPLLQNLIFSHHHSLLSAASELPPHEVTSDLLFLLELVATANASHGGDAGEMIPASAHTCRLIHDVCYRVSLQLNPSSWTLVLNCFAKILDFLLGAPGNTPSVSPNANASAPRTRTVMDCLETLRRFTIYRKTSVSEDVHLVKFLLNSIECLQTDLVFSYRYRQSSSANAANRCSGLWEFQALAFTMLGEAFSASGSSFPRDICQSIIEVLRKVMDVLGSKSLLVEDNVMSRFYASLLQCLHLILVDPKVPLSDHVSSFVSALRMFFVYGLSSRIQPSCPDVAHKEKQPDLMTLNLNAQEPKRRNHAPYRPPHLRKKESINLKQDKVLDSQCLSDHESSVVDLTSLDSDYSDSEKSLNDPDCVQRSKVRVAALVCLQDLCQADPKSFTSQLTILLPTNDVLRPRKFEATLMTVLLFDPYLKARMTSASTLAVMMDGLSSVFLQVAEYKESNKYGSFMALSSSLGLILMQLHTGILYLVQCETHSRLLGSLFKILVLLISCTPYSRMPGDLLPTVITSLEKRIGEGFLFKTDQTGLLVAAMGCLTAALCTSPSLLQVREILLEEISTEFVEAGRRSGILLTLFQYSEKISSPATCFEALQALRAVSHNYPNLMSACWERVSGIVYKILTAATSEVSPRTWRGQVGNTSGCIGEKVIAAAIKVLDECLRAISGFKGTEDLLDDKSFDTPFTSDCMRTKKVSSAPSYGSENFDCSKEPKACQSANVQWSEAIDNHVPLVLHHTSAMVRTASVTCFAGITSSVLFSLTEERRVFILSSVMRAAFHDDAPSVRSAACRAIGVISTFPEISQCAEILDKFIHVVEINTRNPLVSVRITASWALANICDSLRYCIDDLSREQSTGPNLDTQLIELLRECALRLTEDGDKVKSNAVRALGNISRFVKFTSSPAVHNNRFNCTRSSLTLNNAELLPGSSCKDSLVCGSNLYHPTSFRDSRWLEKMVQAFLSCVATGNVKVQWNVCHAFSNLFLNETIELQDMDWAPSVFSILLLLLRDSSNFKIRIQAAAALAVPASAIAYGKSFSDVVQGVEHILENVSSDKVSAPSNFKYRIALEKQLTSTMLHVLSLVSSTDYQPLKDFLVKKASFLEDWLKLLCSSLGKSNIQPGTITNSVGSQKKEMISEAIRSLVEVYKCRNQSVIAQQFENLKSSMEHEAVI